MRRTPKIAILNLIITTVAFFPAATAFADQHTAGVPVLNSRPGATYTVYIDPAGFNFNGNWSTSTPGNNLGLNNLPANGTFGAADVTEINAIWAAMANQYRSFNVNVTTVDPAIAAGQAATDAQRQAYYDSQAHMMHTVIGAGNWQPGTADGLALLNTIDHVAANNGEHTNWMFTNAENGTATVANGNYIGNVASHETGHTFGLTHQGDFTAGVLVNEYSNGDDANGNGNYVPTMGNASDRQRVAWRVGTSHANTVYNQNDVKNILGNDGAALVDSGIGHSFATATSLPISGGTINLTSPLHRGVISPVSSTGPVPIGTANYTTDMFSFLSDGTTPISLTCNDGDDLLQAGTADNGLTLRSVLSIYDSTQTLVATATEDASTLFENYSGTLGAGTYYAKITSFGGHNEVTASYDAAQYYDMGGYFLTGSGFSTVAVPEPATLGLLAIGGIAMLRRRRNRN